jgi:D-3-phosphoglycerate dehydrogenase
MPDGALRCLIVQPIDPQGEARLREAGVALRHADSPAMASVARQIGDCDAVITRSAGLSREAMASAPRLRVIGNHGVGLNAVDVAAATELGIPVVNTPGANADSVAELAVALTLGLAKQLSAG